MDEKYSNRLKDRDFKDNWKWWPLLPLYPYGKKKTLFKELIPNLIWSFEQLQGIYYVAVPVRLIVVKVSEGLMLINPLSPTPDLIEKLKSLENFHGPVLSIVLPTSSGLEHKIFLPALARTFPKAKLWISPGQWSFPLQLPLDWLGIPKRRTNVLLADGLPHEDCCEWVSLGPLDIGLGRFQEISCFHKRAKALIVTDALIGIEAKPPDIFDLDPTALLFHSRDSGDEPLKDSLKRREKGWLRLVLFASFLKPENLLIPPLRKVIGNSFKPGLRNKKSHFGIYPFDWQEGWEESANELVGSSKPLIQIAPVLERLVFPRSKDAFLIWLSKIMKIHQMRWLISSHYSAPVRFTTNNAKQLKIKVLRSEWARDGGNWSFLSWLDKKLLSLNIVPKDPMSKFRD